MPHLQEFVLGYADAVEEGSVSSEEEYEARARVGEVRWTVENFVEAAQRRGPADNARLYSGREAEVLQVVHGYAVSVVSIPPTTDFPSREWPISERQIFEKRGEGQYVVPAGYWNRS